MGNTQARQIVDQLAHVETGPPDIPEMEVGEKLGSGSFGDAWLATWRRNIPGEEGELKVAVKVPNFRTRRNRELLASFRREGEIMRDLKHRNIIGVKRVDEHDGLPYIVMELAAKGNLREFAQKLKGKEYLSGGRTRCRMFVGLASGMEYLEEKRIVHRDLAARNVLVSDSGTCKITDFGLTRQMISQTAPGSLTFQNHEYAYISGNPNGAFPILWSAPEVFHGTSTTKSDVWSFGVVLWEVMAFGETPYAALTDTRIIGPTGINAGALLAFLEAGTRLGQPDGCRDDVYQLMTDAWAKLPEDRPSFSTIRRRLAEIAGPIRVTVECAIM
eukprot:scpid87504/ scgid34784/ Fibroblast growth factor receptor 1; Basic fibroblast growth factor receptor 1; Tyrosine kinase receptor CEK1